MAKLLSCSVTLIQVDKVLTNVTVTNTFFTQFCEIDHKITCGRLFHFSGNKRMHADCGFCIDNPISSIK